MAARELNILFTTLRQPPNRVDGKTNKPSYFSHIISI